MEQLTASPLVVHCHPGPVPVGFVKPDGTVSVTVVVVGGVSPHAEPVFVRAMVKVTVLPDCMGLGFAILVIEMLQGAGGGVIVTCAHDWLFAGLWS